MSEREWFINAAISFDARLGERNKQINISSDEDWRIVHKFRNQIAAIVVGANTINIDNPSLRTKKDFLDAGTEVRHPVRVVLDRSGIVNHESKVFQNIDKIPTIWCTETTASIEGVIKIKSSDLKLIMSTVNEYCDSIGREGDIMIEGGANVINNFIASGLISKMRLYRSNIVLPNGLPLFDRNPARNMDLVKVTKLGPGVEEIYQIGELKQMF